MKLLIAAGVVILASHAYALGFGGGSSCGGCPAPAAAPPPAPIAVCAPPPVQNSCGSGCGGGGGGGGGCGCVVRRRVIRRRVTRDTVTHITEISNSTEEDPRCNSKELREIILNNISEDAEKSKVGILNAAKTQMGGHFAVICSQKSFTYIADSHVFCLDGNAALNCYAFQV